MKLLLLGALLLASGWTCAADRDGKHAVLGSVSCGRFIEDRKEGRWQATPHAAWIEGYVTAYNTHVPDTYNLLGANDVEQVIQKLENWCSVNVDKPLLEGLEKLIVALYPRRQRAAQDAVK